ncbi:MAG: hypothetical protein CMM55_10605 [Rhodospirillaceae bacterium]|nr:hypothetical protein [Rhodospirillaceae bacterium]|tara:strand:- start:2247 stop:2492 length:246 start_codon:yes stop_codon:yes gene_type:complete
MEQKKFFLGSRYALHLGELQRWHRLRVTCFRCRHEASVDLEKLRPWFREHTLLRDLEKKFICSACGNSVYNVIRVARLARD